jgi:hypothetical protein
MAKIAILSNEKHIDGMKYQTSLKLSLKGCILNFWFYRITISFKNQSNFNPLF